MVIVTLLDQRRVVLEEINRLLPQLSASGDFTPLTAARLKRSIDNPNFHIFFAVDSEKPYPDSLVGLGTIFFQWNLGHCIAEIHDVVVDKKHRGRGYGDMITEALISHASAFSKRHRTELKLYLTSRQKRKSANRMYQKHGFTLVAKATGTWGTNLYKMVVLPDGSIKTHD